MGPGVRGRSVEGLKTIWIAPQPYLPRRTLTICHELLELALPRHWDGDLRERMCQRGAAALILPSRAYEQAFKRAKGDLALLRRWHRWASWETLGRRAADIMEGVRFRAWADGRPRNEDELEAAEVAAVEDALAHGMGVSVQRGVVAQAWALTERGAESRLVSLSVTVAR